MKINSIYARQILDSRGNPTVEAEVTAKEGTFRGVAPSGASTGIHEAIELRDRLEKAYDGKGVLQAVKNVNEIIAPALKGKTFKAQFEADQIMLELDGTPNKSKLGANATVAVSMAVARALAASAKKPYWQYLGGSSIPKPMFNIVNGGKHAGGKLAIQEFMILPQGKTMSESLRMAAEIYHILGKRLEKKCGSSARNVGDEGGFAPPLDTTEEALVEILAACEEAGYERSVQLAMDCAASSFYDTLRRSYTIDGNQVSSGQLHEYYLDLIKRFPLTSIEDPFHEDDFAAHAEFTRAVKSKVRVVGDDLLVTNPKRIVSAIQFQACTALLLKVNQIGTVTESLAAAELCKKNNMEIIVSHRSGETEDTFIADFAVGINAQGIKTGAPARGERTAKYNQLLRIEEALAKPAKK